MNGVIPAKGGIYVSSKVRIGKEIDSRLRGNDSPIDTVHLRSP